MPAFLKTHVKRKHFCVINQIGNTLSLHEWDGKEEDSSERLVGYSMYADENQAKLALKSLLATRIQDGFEPKDEDGKSLLLSMNLKAEKKIVKNSLPLRQDFYCYNEATGFSISNSKMLGVEFEDGDNKWMRAVKNGSLIPVELVQDDPFVLRVLAGEGLNLQEQEEWVGKIETFLDLPDGKLCMAGGAEHIYGGEEALEFASEYLHFIELPKGFYRATLYMYVPGVNGQACLDHLAGGYEKSEPLGKWFRRTRAGQEFPCWLYNYCVGDRGTDPGHEKEWEKKEWIRDEDIIQYCDFLLHLEAVEKEAIKQNNPEAQLNGGWFKMEAGARKPEKCPLGIVAIDPQKNENSRAAGKWVWPQTVYPVFENFKDMPLAGGELELDIVSDLPYLYQISQFCQVHVLPELIIKTPAGKHFDTNGEWEKDTVAIPEDAHIRIGFGLNTDSAGFVQRLIELGSRLKKLPEGSHLDFYTSSYEQREAESVVPGTHAFKGLISNSKFILKSSFPQMTKESLEQAVELARAACQDKELELASKEEGIEIKKRAMACFPYHFTENKALVENKKIRLKEHDQSLFKLLAGAAFFLRLQDFFKIQDLLDDDDDDEDEDFEEDEEDEEDDEDDE